MLVLTLVFQPIMISLACNPGDPPPDCSSYEAALAAARALLEDACAAMDAANAALDAAIAAYASAKQAEEQRKQAYENAQQVLQEKTAQYNQAKAALDIATIAYDDATRTADACNVAFWVAVATKNPFAIYAAYKALKNALLIHDRLGRVWAQAMAENHIANIAYRAASSIAKVMEDRWEAAKAETKIKEQIMLEKQNAYAQAFQNMLNASEAVYNAWNNLNNCLNTQD